MLTLVLSKTEATSNATNVILTSIILVQIWSVLCKTRAWGYEMVERLGNTTYNTQVRARHARGVYVEQRWQ